MNDNRTAALYIQEPPALAALAIDGSDKLFAVRRVYCVGRNYAAHAVEMGHDPSREEPFFFQKNPDDLDTGGSFAYPVATSEVHHEIELMVALGKGGTNIPVATALDHVFGYGLALDMTRRDLQQRAKAAGLPWEIGKAFEGSAPCTPLRPASVIGHPSRGAISLDINGERRQSGDLDQMIWKVPEIIAYLSGVFTLKSGDVILTGTPAGVGPVACGEVMSGAIEGVGKINVRVIDRLKA